MTNNMCRSDFSRPLMMAFAVAALAVLPAVRGSEVAAQTKSLQAEAIVKGLAHHDSTVRSAAAYRAISLKDASLLDVLVGALSDTDTLVRLRVASAIVAIPDDRVREVVLRHLSHPDPGVRSAMYYYFVAQPKLPAELLGTLAKGLTDSDNTVRLRAALAIRKLPGDTSKDVMTGLLEHEDPALRNQAVTWVREHPTPDVVSVLAKRIDDRDNTVRSTAATWLRALASDGTADVMLKIVQHHDPTVRQQAAVYFSAKPDPRATKLLIAALNDIDNTVRSYAVTALEKVDDAQARTAVAAFRKLEEDAPDAKTLVNNASTAADLGKLLQHRDSNVRRAAVTKLRGLNGQDALQAAIVASKHADGFVRVYAIYRLAELPDAAATPALKEALNDRDSRVRKIAAQALSATPGEAATKVALASLDHADPAVREYLFNRMAAHPDASLIPTVNKSLEDIDATVRRCAAMALRNTVGAEATKAALAALSHPDPVVRSHAAIRFAERPDATIASVVPKLVAGLSDIDSSVRKHAAMGLRKTPGDVAAQATLAAFGHADPAVRIQVVYRFVDQPDVKASTAISKMLGDPNKDVRLHVMSALYHSGDAHAVKSLSAFIDDDDAEIRLRAGSAIKALVQRFPAAAIGMSATTSAQDETVEGLQLLPPTEVKLPSAYVELLGGDRIAGSVVGFVGGKEASRLGLPPHLLVVPTSCSVVSVSGTKPETSGVVRVVLAWVRRVIWERRRGTVHYQPGTLLLREGGHIEFRSVKWSGEGVTVLTTNGIERVAHDDIAELHLPKTDPWQAWYEQLAMSGVDPSQTLLRVGSVAGSKITVPRSRYRPHFNTDLPDPQNWEHAFQPAWSLDLLLMSQSKVWLRSFGPATSAPLFPPDDYEPRKNALFPWQLDGSVHHKPLVSGKRQFHWGFGVHADNVLQFHVPAAAVGFETHLGLDQSVGRGGCARGLVKLRHGNQLTELYKSSLLIGSEKVHSTGNLQLSSIEPGAVLELVADSAHDDRPRGADPIFIRDMLNWSEPQFLLDPDRMRSSMETRTPQVVADMTGWRMNDADGETARLVNPWWTDKQNRFQAVVVVDRTPVTLTRTIPANAKAHQLLLDVWRTNERVESARIEISIDGIPTTTVGIPIRTAKQKPMPIAIPFTNPADRDVTLTVRHLDKSTDAEIHWGQVSFDDTLPSPFALFEDHGTLTPVGDTETARGTLVDTGAFSGGRAIKLTPGGRFRLPAHIVLKIREQPADDTFRYFRFAFRKVGGGRVSLELHQAKDQARLIRYDAGVGEPSYGASTKTWSAGIPDEWVMVEIDLFAEWGESDIDGLVVGTPDGEYALIDYVYLARDRRDFSRITGVPSIADNNRRARRALIQPILDKTTPAVVAIEVDGRKGTGVMIGDEGYILTAKSVLVANDRKAIVRLANGTSVTGQTFGITPDSDCGLIKLDKKPTSPGLKLSKKSDLPKVGIYVGFSYSPQAYGGKTAASYLTVIKALEERTFQTDFSIPGALTGGPLFDAKGDVVGIHTGITAAQSKHFSRVIEVSSRLANKTNP